MHFRLWKKHGVTPLWAVFAETDWGRASDVQAVLEPWVSDERIFAANDDDGSYVVALEIPTHEEKDAVVRSVAGRLEEMGRLLVSLTPLDDGTVAGE